MRDPARGPSSPEVGPHPPNNKAPDPANNNAGNEGNNGANNGANNEANNAARNKAGRAAGTRAADAAADRAKPPRAVIPRPLLSACRMLRTSAPTRMATHCSSADGVTRAVSHVSPCDARGRERARHLREQSPTTRAPTTRAPTTRGLSRRPSCLQEPEEPVARQQGGNGATPTPTPPIARPKIDAQKRTDSPRRAAAGSRRRTDRWLLIARAAATGTADEDLGHDGLNILQGDRPPERAQLFQPRGELGAGQG